MDNHLAFPPSLAEPAREIVRSRFSMKRSASFAASVAFAFALSACGFVSNSNDPSTADPQAAAQDADTSAASGQTPTVQTSAPQAAAAATVSRPSNANAASSNGNSSNTTTTTSPTTTSPTTTTTIAGKTNSADIIVNDMKLNNDFQLAGVPIERGWATGPGFVIMGNDPRGTRTPTWWNPYNQVYKSDTWWTHFAPWMVIFDGVGNAATNTRVELRQLKAYYKSRSTGQWILLDQGQIDGKNFPKYLNAVAANDAPDLYPIGGGAVSVLPPPTDLHFHGWCCGLRLPAPWDIAAIHITTQARLTVNNPGLPDDRASSRYMLQVGGDYYPDSTLNVNLFAPDNWNPGIGLSRSKLITNAWQSFSFTTINVGVQISPGASISEAELRANPPPLD